MSKVLVDKKRCKKCGYCIAYCPKQVFTAADDGTSVVSQEEECLECGLCYKLCPDYAIILNFIKD